MSNKKNIVAILGSVFKKKEVILKEDGPRSETDGVKNFTKEMISALVTALIFIVYVIQAFTIPTGSMEKSLLVGDFLLGLKFVYGAPIIPGIPKVVDTYWKFPGITTPKRGDVVIFKYPGKDNKDYIKRCVAIAGDSVEVKGTKLFVNGVELVNPPKSQHVRDGELIPKITDFAPLYVPKKGDTLDISTAPIREFVYYKHLIHQEHPYDEVTEKFKLFENGVNVSDSIVSFNNGYSFKFSALDFPSLDRSGDWSAYSRYFDELILIFTGDVEIKKQLFLDGEEITEYLVKKDNYFMMGDNRDNSFDSRFWGFVNQKFIKAKAFIVYFSLDKEVPIYLLPIKIRWNKLGTLIRRWDGKPEGVESLAPEDNPRLKLVAIEDEVVSEEESTTDSSTSIDTTSDSLTEVLATE